MSEREIERAAVVAWLRGRSVILRRSRRNIRSDNIVTAVENHNLKLNATFCDEAADAIEAGEHLE